MFLAGFLGLLTYGGVLIGDPDEFRYSGVRCISNIALVVGTR
jgi:hypothetical protein